MATIHHLHAKAHEAESAPVDRLLGLLEDEMASVDHTIIDQMQSPVALIPQLAGHLVASGGKRIRPLLTLAGARLCEYTGKRHIGLAACIEFIHTATLLHDDVIDASELRRGSASANSIWGNQASVLVGDFLFSRAFQLMVMDGSMRVLKLLSDASATIAEGEVLQLQTVRAVESSESEYMQVIKAKTAALFKAATKVSALVSEMSVEYEQALAEYGMNFGIAFQLADDVLDYGADQDDIGKTVGDDFREGKVTLPVLLAFRRGNDEDRAFWRRTIGRGDIEDHDLARAIAMMHRYDALQDSLHRARHYATVAADALNLFPASLMRDTLIALARSCVDRCR
ncbi:MAG: polyprenyl synthetase family protein, partial [Pseudomonadota bacterium]